VLYIILVAQQIKKLITRKFRAAKKQKQEQAFALWLSEA
jgi:hypothetical protein